MLIAAALWFFRDELDPAAALEQLRNAAPGQLALGVVCSVLSLTAMAEVMRTLLGAGGTHPTLRDTTSLTFAANALSSSFPGGAAISTVMQFQVMRQWRASPLLISWFIVFSGALSTVWLIALGVGAVALQGADFRLSSMVLPLVGMLMLAGLMWWITNHPEPVARFAERALPPLLRLAPRRAPALEDITAHIYQLEAVRLTRFRFGWAACCSLSNWLLDAATLSLALWAITDTPPAFGAVLLAFITSKIVGSTNLTPGGLGPVDGALVGTLIATGVASPDALGAAILYRAISLGLITACGWVIYLFSPWRSLNTAAR
ncbi:MAG: YbhN family protein [Corynebacterium sp.]|nr:YbhN family protein [Corynebacterium sp.]MDO5076736.1 YbhN family protein [Corynebacterium sp.]